MSRRTKLCITALFLVLLAVPAAYLILTWHPPNPLRFRILGERAEKDPLGGSGYHWMRMELRNTSHVTVMFVAGALFGQPEPGDGTADLGLWCSMGS